MAIESLEKALLQVGNCEEQLLKIRVALILIQLYTGDTDSKRREHYFYIAVEVAQQYL